ncbi:MAG TPA: NAD(P)-dependent oxidoreductase, partial [Solirubrobacteraceae bacterium]|nr:NAD(P)-dependent oxidoreductase [Solirubrobacteraceae bacterium]
AADGDEPLGIDLAGADRRADITDPAATVAALGGADAVVHAAALVSERGRMAEFVRINTRGTRNVLDAAAGRRAVVIASVAGWGYEFTRELGEDAPPRPCGIPYVDTKGATETLALRRGATVIRPGDVYGPGSRPWVVRPLEMMRAGRFYLPAPGDGLITPIFVDDLVDAIVRALRAPRTAGRAYTIWDGHAVTAREFFGHHARSLGQDEVRVLPAPLLRILAGAFGAGPAAVTFMSRRATYPNRRAREELGWSPRFSLAEGMARTL